MNQNYTVGSVLYILLYYLTFQPLTRIDMFKAGNARRVEYQEWTSRHFHVNTTSPVFFFIPNSMIYASLPQLLQSSTNTDWSLQSSSNRDWLLQGLSVCKYVRIWFGMEYEILNEHSLLYTLWENPRPESLFHTYVYEP